MYERTLLPQKQQGSLKQSQQVEQHHATQEIERVSVEQDNRHALELDLKTLQQKARQYHHPITLLSRLRQPHSLPIHQPSRPLTRPHKGQHQRNLQEKAKTQPPS